MLGVGGVRLLGVWPAVTGIWGQGQTMAWEDIRALGLRGDERPGPHIPASRAPPAFPQDILNHVFDDVEDFVSRLQKSAEAARVLEHRERGRRTRRREAGGEGRPRVGS